MCAWAMLAGLYSVRELGMPGTDVARSERDEGDLPQVRQDAPVQDSAVREPAVVAQLRVAGVPAFEERSQAVLAPLGRRVLQPRQVGDAGIVGVFAGLEALAVGVEGIPALAFDACMVRLAHHVAIAAAGQGVTPG